jgi:hypothetical protein
MSGRTLDTATATAFDNLILPMAAIVYLDVQGDPLFAWSGIGDLTFAAGQTGDANLDGLTFTGTGSVIEIGNSSEGIGGSDSLELSLPGVDINDNELKQVVTNRNRWQFRRAVVWLVLLDPDNGSIVGQPFRIKTGRMDQMPYSEDGNGNGIIKCTIEGQQSYGNNALSTRYAEQTDLNPNDTSQKYVFWLANITSGAAGVAGASSVIASGGGAGSQSR